MPLRAIVDGAPAIAPLMSFEEWLVLKRRKPRVELLCCGAPGHMRTSPGGLQHFYHASASAHCTSAYESPRHLMLKAAAFHGALDAGWAAELEANDANGFWRADVLCSHGEDRVALEVQLSKLSLAELGDRSSTYAESSVQDLWFMDASTLHVGELRRVMGQSTMPRDFFLQCPRPVFELSGDQVRIDTVQLPLRRTVEKLLTRHFRHVPCRKIAVDHFMQVLRLNGCPSCKRPLFVYFTGVKRTPACNVTALGALGCFVDSASPRAISTVRKWPFLQDAEPTTHGSDLSSFRAWVCSPSDQLRCDSRCPHCGHSLPRGTWRSLFERNYNRQFPCLRLDSLREVTLSREIEVLEDPHWCHSTKLAFCVANDI